MQIDHEKIGPFQFLLLALSILVLAILFVEGAFRLRPDTKEILLDVDTAICFVFIYDFFHRLIASERKLHFLKWGWIDLVSSIPAFHFMRLGRSVRIFRVIRLLRGIRSIKTIGAALFAHRAKGALATAVFTCTLIVVFSSVAVLHVEVEPDSNIHGPADALWWSLVTITTVGYGDRYPVTPEGRLIALGLMTAGVGLFAVLAGFIASWFMEPGAGKQDDQQGLQEELGLLKREIQALRADLKERRAGNCARPGLDDAAIHNDVRDDPRGR